jgi:chromosome segregation ATPase
MGKSEKKRKAPEPGTDIPYGNGTIMKVKVSNFMCHKNLEVDLGPRINFIVGENGSGKSAVLTALSVCLGMRKAAKERSDRGMKGFIREGSTQAKVEVSIRNHGADALDPDAYGDVITVERVINANGSAPFKIRNRWGKEMGSSRDALTRLTDHFNIDVDNPIVVMSQDSSRQFLHSGKDSDKYKFFVKATLLEEIQTKIAYIKDLVKNMDSQIAEQEERLPAIESEVKRLQEEYDSYEAIEELREKMLEYRRRLAWAEVYHSELMLAQTEEEGARYRDTVRPQLDKTVAEQAATTENCLADCVEAKRKLDEQLAASNVIMEEVNAAREKHTRLLREKTRADTNVLNHANALKSATTSRKELEDAIADARVSLQQHSQAQDTSLRKAVEVATQERAELKSRLDELTARLGRHANAERESRAALHDAEMAVKDEEKKLADSEMKLREANTDKGNLLDKFAGRNAPEKLRKLVELVKKRASEFSQPPIGPIGMHVRLKEEKWADAVEECIGQGLGGWLVGNSRDRDVLDKMIRHDCQMENFSITSTSLNRARYDMPAEKLPPKSFKTMLDVLEIDHNGVFNNLVDASQIERVVLVPEHMHARPIVQEHKTVNEVFAPDRRVSKRGAVVADRAFRTGLRAKLSADKKERVTSLKAEIAEFKKNLVALRKDVTAAREAAARVARAKDEDRRELRTAREALAKAEDAFSELRARADEGLGVAGVDVRELENELEPIVEELEGPLRRQGEELKNAQTAAAAAAKLAHDEHEELKDKAANQAPLFEQLQKEVEQANGTLNNAKAHAKYYAEKQLELAAKIAENDTSVSQLREAVSLSVHGAKKVCDRATAEAYLAEREDGKEASIQELQKLYDQVTKRVRKEEERLGRPRDRVQRELNAQTKQLQRLQETLMNSREPCRKLQRGVKSRQRLLKEASTAVQKEVSHRFNIYLQKKGNAGKINVDYNNGSLELDVKMAGSGSTVKDTRSLSGGERSYSTLALTLSLGEAIESPFRAMDEFDVFMDAVNRKVSMDNLIEFARDDLNSDKQFLFITPQDISAVDAADPDIKVQRMKAARPN